MKPKASLRFFILPASIALLAAPSVWAASGDWNVDSAGDWSLDTNWNPVAVPGTAAGDVIGLANNITAARTVTIDTTPRTAGTLNISDSDNTHAFTLAASGGGTLTFDNSGSGASLNETGSVTDVVSAPITLNDNLAVTVPGSLTLSGAIGESGGAKSITKTGAGTLRLNNSNTYSGSTIVNEGILSLGSTGALGSTSAITLAGGTRMVPTLDLLTINAPITLGTAGTTSTINAPAFGSIGGDVHTVTLAGAISGDGNVTFLGTQSNNVYGTVVLNAASTYTGTTLMNTDAATSNKNIFVRLDVNNALPVTTVLTMDGNTGTGTAPGRQCALNLNGKNQTLAGLTNIARNLRVQKVYSSSAATLTINDSGNRTFSGQIGNGGTNISVVKDGAGTWTLSGANTYVGTTTISAGAINIQHATALGGVTNGTSVASGAALQIQGGITVGAEALTLNGTGITSTGALRNISGTNTYNGIITLGSDSQIASDAGTLTLGGGITGSGFGFTKTGNGTITLTAASDYTGLTTVNGGAVVVQNANALGTTAAGTVVNGTNTGNANNARLDLAGGVTVTGEAVTLSGVGNFTGALTSSIGNNVWAGPVTIGAAGTRIGASAGASLEMSGVIDSGVNAFGPVIRTTDLTGVVVFSGINTYLGNTQVLIGKLQLAGGDNRLPVGTTLTFGSSGTNPDAELDLNGTNQEVAGIALTGGALKNSVNNSSGTLSTLTVNTTAPSSFAGILKGNLALTKTGADTLTLGGINSYTGATAVNEGTLGLNGASLTSVVTVASGASIGFTLGAPSTTTGTLDLTTGTVKIIGTLDNASDYQLMTATGGITGSLTLDVSIPDYQLELRNSATELWLAYVGTGGYSAWASLNGAGVNLDDDHDGDGVSNGVEYFIGGPNGNTSGFTPLPGVTNTAGTLSVTFTKAAGYIGVYGTDYEVEVSTTLGSWGPALGGSVTFPTATEVKYTFPPGTKNFARLKVTGP